MSNIVTIGLSRKSIESTDDSKARSDSIWSVQTNNRSVLSTNTNSKLGSNADLKNVSKYGSNDDLKTDGKCESNSDPKSLFESCSVPKRPPAKINCHNVFYTFAVMFIYYGYGVGNTMFGPSLVDLSYIYEVKENQMNLGPLFISIGYVFGALAAGQLSRWYENRQILVACFLIPMGVVPSVVLHVYPLVYALILFFIFGSGLGATDAIMSVWIIELWPYHNSIILPLSSVLFGVGQVVGPLTISPFVFGHIAPDDIEHQNITRIDRIQSLQRPYLYTTLTQTLIPALFVIFNFTSFRYKKPEAKFVMESEEEEADPRQTQNPYRFYHLCLAGIGVATYAAAELGWDAFAPTMFQHMGDRMFDASEAALLVAVWSGAFAVGLLITTFVAMKFTPDKIIFFQFGVVFSSLLLLYFAHSTKFLVYAATILFGSGMSSLWAMKFAFIEIHLKLTDQVASFYTVLFGVFGILIPIILEKISTQYPLALLPLIMAFLGLSAVAFTSVKLWLNVVESKQSKN